MIQANELRIGNWVRAGRIAKSDKDGNQLSEFKDNCIRLTQNDFLDQRFWKALDVLTEPIPLTPEILIAAGFKQSDEFAHFYRLEDFDIEFCFGGWYWVVDDRGGNEGTKARQIYYLHQLQNLYFALTGNELTIKL